MGAAKGAPGARIAVPPAAGKSQTVLTVGGDGQVRRLVPFAIPTVGAVAGIHADENNGLIA